MSIAQATIANSNTTILTVTSGQNWRVFLSFCNVHSATTETLTVYLVPRGSSAGDATTLIKSFSVPAKATLIWTDTEPLHLDSGDSLIAVGATGSLITATASYTPE